jgi:hypothetical protein
VATLGRSPRQAVDQSGLKSGFFTDDYRPAPDLKSSRLFPA